MSEIDIEIDYENLLEKDAFDEVIDKNSNIDYGFDSYGYSTKTYSGNDSYIRGPISNYYGKSRYIIIPEFTLTILQKYV